MPLCRRYGLPIGGFLDVVYASALWYASTKVNCHHLAERLAEKTPVLFVESVGARLPRMHEWRRLLPRLLRSLTPLRRIGRNLWVFSPLPLPLYKGRGTERNSAWVGWQVNALAHVFGWQVETLWSFHPMALGTARVTDARARIYYCVDDYSANPGVDPEALRSMEQQLAGLSDAILVTGAPLTSRFASDSKKVKVLPNVANRRLFESSGERGHPALNEIERLPRPRVGYVGNLAAYKVDLALVARIALARPAWSIVLVGPTDQGDIERSIGNSALPQNVHLMGEVPHEVVPGVIRTFDVAILPSARHDVMLASFPLKFFEYLLSGVPVVAKPIPALLPFSEMFEAASSAEDFVEAIERSLKHDNPDAVNRRKAFASRFNWDDRMEVLWELRSDLLGASSHP